MNIEMVIFDYGQVLSGPADAQVRQRMVELCGASNEIFEREYWRHRQIYDAGECDGQGYWHRVAAGVQVALAEKDIEQLIAADVRMWSVLDYTMVEWTLRLARAGIATGILSNICAELSSSLTARCQWLEMMSHKFWSSEIRCAKPDPRIYQHVLKKVNVPAKHILFIDDKKENVEGAKACGIVGIHYKGADTLKRQLREIGADRQLPELPPPGWHSVS